MAMSKPLKYSVISIVAILLALIILIAVTFLVTFLLLKPKQLVYTIEDGSVHGFKLTKDHLNATFNFTINSYNPNTKLSVFYYSTEVSVSYNNQIIAYGVVEPFYQPHQNLTQLEVQTVTQYVTLSEDMSKDLKQVKSSGEIKLSVQINADIRFKLSIGKSEDQKLKILCDPVLVYFGSSKNFEKTYCNTKI